MKFNKLAKVLTTFLAAPLAAAPTPESLEITLSIDSVAESASAPWTSNLRFLGATPSAYYDMNVNVDRKTFKIGLSVLSLTFISLSFQTSCVLRSQHLLHNYSLSDMLSNSHYCSSQLFQSTLPPAIIIPIIIITSPILTVFLMAHR